MVLLRFTVEGSCDISVFLIQCISYVHMQKKGLEYPNPSLPRKFCKVVHNVWQMTFGGRAAREIFGHI